MSLKIETVSDILPYQSGNSGTTPVNLIYKEGAGQIQGGTFTSSGTVTTGIQPVNDEKYTNKPVEISNPNSSSNNFPELDPSSARISLADDSAVINLGLNPDNAQVPVKKATLAKPTADTSGNPTLKGVTKEAAAVASKAPAAPAAQK